MAKHVEHKAFHTVNQLISNTSLYNWRTNVFYGFIICPHSKYIMLPQSIKKLINEHCRMRKTGFPILSYRYHVSLSNVIMILIWIILCSVYHLTSTFMLQHMKGVKQCNVIFLSSFLFATMQLRVNKDTKFTHVLALCNAATTFKARCT